MSYLSYGSHSAGGDYYHGTRRTFATPNIGMAGVPANLQHTTGYADNNSNSFAVADDYQRFNIDLSATRYGHWKGEHAFKIGGLYERIGNQANLGEQHPNITLNWGSVYSSPSGFTRTGPFGYFEVRRILHRRRHQGDQPQLLRAGSVDGQQQADAELRPAPGKRGDPVLQPGRAGREVRMGRQDRAAPRVRLRLQG